MSDFAKDTNVPINDTISRQAAISLVHKNYDTILDFKSDGRTVADSFEDIINTLPPAQPEHGIKFDFDECTINELKELMRKQPLQWIPAQPEITLEIAIDYLYKIGWLQEHDKEMYEMGLKEQLSDDSDSYDSLIPSAQPKPDEWCTDCKEYNLKKHCCPRFNKVIRNALKDAQPEKKKGKWIVRDNPGTGWYRVTCSKCGEDVTSTIPMVGFFPNAKPLWDYCPYCGTKMEAEDNGKQ